MRLARLAAQGFAGLPDGTYSFGTPGRPTPNELTLVAGVRGSGKTRLLEAIVALKELVGAYRAPPSRRSLLDRNATAGSLGGTFLLTDEERSAAELDSNELSVSFRLVSGSNVAGDGAADAAKIARPVRALFERFDCPGGGKLEYFPASRLLAPHGEPTSPDTERIVRFGHGTAKYAGLVPSLIAMSVADGARTLREAQSRGVVLGMDAPDALAPYRAAMSKLVPELRLRGAEPGEAGPPFLAFERPSGTLVDAHELSEAQKQAVLLAGTIVRLGLSNSIVLLDSPELHIHVADQARFLEVLMSIGHENQWIVATGSSEIMKTARREQMIALPSRSA